MVRGYGERLVGRSGVLGGMKGGVRGGEVVLGRSCSDEEVRCRGDEEENQRGASLDHPQGVSTRASPCRVGAATRERDHWRNLG